MDGLIRQMRFEDLNYLPLSSDSSIYGMTSLDLDDGTCKLLVATQSCQIFCIDYVRFQAHCREVEFTYIPSGAKIISIDAFKRPNSKSNDFVIGITHSLSVSAQTSSAQRSSTMTTSTATQTTTNVNNILAINSSLLSASTTSQGQGASATATKTASALNADDEMLLISSVTPSGSTTPMLNNEKTISANYNNEQFVQSIRNPNGQVCVESDVGSATTSSPAPAQISEVGDCDKNQTYYLNVYASGIYSPESFDLDYIAQGCLTLPINYVPYHLYHTQLILPQPQLKLLVTDKHNESNGLEMVWLLSGGDRSMHVFRENKNTQCFVELPTNELVQIFPEFSEINSIVLWIDVNTLVDPPTESNLSKKIEIQRLCAMGLEDGTIMLRHSVYSHGTCTYQLVSSWTNANHLTIIPSVKLFTQKSNAQFMSNDERKREKINLLVVSATESALIFHDVLRNGLQNPIKLPESQRVDCNTCATVGDINCDGFNEIVIGSYGQEVCIYRSKNNLDYYLKQVISLNHPVSGVKIMDITGSGTKDILVLSTRGIHIYQAPVCDLLHLIEQRIEKIL